MKKLSILLLFTLMLQFVFAQTDKQNRMFYGFNKKIKGVDYIYNFPVPGITNSLIIRGEKSFDTMEFETEIVPNDYKNKTVDFMLPVGYHTISGSIIIDLFINGEKTYSFKNNPESHWKLNAPDGGSLSFDCINYDQNRSSKGLMYLRVPTSALKKGEPAKLKFVTQDVKQSTWFMVYTDKIIPEIKLTLMPAIYKNSQAGKQKLVIDVVRFTPEDISIIKVDGKQIAKSVLKPGYNTFTADIDQVTKPKQINVEVQTGNKVDKKTFSVNPSRKWKVNFVQHSHTDIGYTRPQTDILAEQIRYIDYALDYCDLTDSYPDDAKFRWTCEAAWAVEEYLQTRPPKQIERLRKRIKEGRIELTGMLYNFDELPDENSLAASLKPLKEFRKHGLPCNSAMQNDVNGIGWCFADYFNDLGIKYLNMGTHGHRALICFDYPTMFRWQSPSGKEILAYRAEHYNHGNFLEIEKPDFNTFEARTLEYLAKLEQSGYPYELAQAQFSGYFTDNSPPSTQACEHVRRWNEKYEYPQIRISVPNDFFKEMESRYASQFPVIRGAWPDWWTDGFGAGAREASVSRFAHADLITASTGLAMAKLLGSSVPANTKEKMDEALRALLFFDEHTVGYSESVRDPYCQQTMDQRALKESYAWEAHRRARILNETMHGLLQEYVRKDQRPSIAVYNPLSWKRSGVVQVYIDHEILPIKKQFKISDQNGNVVKAQPAESRGDGTYWLLWAEDVPALGSKQYFIESFDKPATPAAFDLALKGDMIKAENQWYTLEMDSKRLQLTGLYDKQLKKDLLDKNATYGLGEFIHEQLKERSSLEKKRMGMFTRNGLDSVWFGGVKRGEIYDTYLFNANTNTAIDLNNKPNYSVQVRLYHTDKRIELAYMIYKKLVTDPESFYIAMPFELPGSKIYFDVPGGSVQAGVDQIKGSANDWNTAQNFVSVRSKDAQIMVASKEIPLWQFGGINTGRYQAGAVPATSHVYSWPMNNYWVTNFNADQRGEFNWSYFITSDDNALNSVATKFGWNSRVPLVGRVLPKSTSNDQQEGKSFDSLLDLGADNILLVNMSAIADENAVLIHLRELDGKETPLQIKSAFVDGINTIESNALGETNNKVAKTIKPYESKFIKLTWK